MLKEPKVAAAVLDPRRGALLNELKEPRSAAELAERLEIPRQKVNYHLRTLESLGLVQVAETRKWGGLTERRMVASAHAYAVSPEALGSLAAETEHSVDRLSASYLIALGGRLVREVGDLVRRSASAAKRLATLSIDTEIRFRSPAERAEFTRELTGAVADLVSRYHDGSAPNGRSFRLVIASHPLPSSSAKEKS